MRLAKTISEFRASCSFGSPSLVVNLTFFCVKVVFIIALMSLLIVWIYSSMFFSSAAVVCLISLVVTTAPAAVLSGSCVFSVKLVIIYIFVRLRCFAYYRSHTSVWPLSPPIRNPIYECRSREAVCRAVTPIST